MSTLQDIDALAGQLAESKRKIELIRSVTFELNKILSLPDKLQNILGILYQQFGIRYSMILLPDQRQEKLVIKSSHGYSNKNIGAEISFGQSIVGIAAVNRKPINITGIRRKRQYLRSITPASAGPPPDIPGLDDPESQIAIPLLSNEELVAVLMAESQTSSVFSKDDETFLITLSQSIAVSIQNSLLFDSMEEMIARRTEELRKSNSTKDRLFSIISHDLRGPITSFHNIARLVNHYNKQGEKEKIEKLSLRIDDSVNRLNHLLDNLLNWSLSQTAEIRCRPAKLNLQQLLSEVIAVYGEGLLAKDISLTTTFHAPAETIADYHTLSTAFRNILSNAIKYTPRGGAINIRTTIADDRLLIHFGDTGVGIPGNRLSSLFDLSERKSTQGTENEKGTGLGLLVANDFIALNGGTLHISSTPGEGTEVRVALPLS